MSENELNNLIQTLLADGYTEAEIEEIIICVEDSQRSVDATMQRNMK